MKKRCIICDSDSSTYIYKNTLLRCGKCKFITANLDLSKQEQEKLYTEKYFFGEEYLDYIREKVALQKNFSKNLNYLYKKEFIKRGINVLEIGCAFGFFGEIIRKEYSCEYSGIDITKKGCEYAKKINEGSNIVCNDYLSQSYKKKFDNVFMWDVIEHLNSPDKFLEKINIDLKRGGLISLTTGDISALLPRIQKHKWRIIHPPTHLHYFSRYTIGKLLKKYGFKVEDIHYPIVYRSVKQIFYSLFMLRKRHSSFIQLIYSKIPSNLFLPINTFDIMLVTARKI